MVRKPRLPSDVRLRNRLERSDYWGGSNWFFHATQVNGGGAAGHEYALIPAKDSEVWILYGHMFNGDTVARNATWFVATEPDTPFGLIVTDIVTTTALGAGVRGGFPVTEQAAAQAWGADAGRWIIPPGLVAIFQIPGISAAQDTNFSMLGRVRGDKPSVQMTVGAGGTSTVNRDEFLF